MKREQFIHFLEGSQRELRRYLAGLCSGNVPMAEDIAQETSIKAYLASEKFNDAGRFKPWIFKIAYNTFISRIRSGKSTTGIEEIKEYSSDEKADKKFEYEPLYKALQALPPKERSAVTLYYLENFSTKEIASIQEISEEGVRQALSRGRKHLRQIIER